MTDVLVNERRYAISRGDVPLVWRKRIPIVEEVIEILRLGHAEVGFVQKLWCAIERADKIRGGQRFQDRNPHLADALRHRANRIAPTKAA